MTLTVACSRFIEADDLPASCTCDLDDDALVDEVLDGVSDVLTLLTGFSYYGVCENTVRPCRGCWCGVCPGCCSIDTIPLRGPVIEITEVKVDGDTLDPGDYRLLPRNRLMRTSSGLARRSWPQNQNVWAEDTENNTFSITYTHGHDPLPIFVRDAAAELACELLASRLPNSKSKLPPNATNVFFQGVTVNMQSKADVIRDGATYLSKVAMLLSVTGVRPGGVYSPDGLDAWIFPTS